MVHFGGHVEPLFLSSTTGPRPTGDDSVQTQTQFALFRGDRIWPILAFSLFMLAALWLSGRDPGHTTLGFPLDDAWIHMVYGRSLATEGMFAYNPGVPATGATSLLWATILGALHLAVGNLGVTALVAATFAVNAVLYLLVVVGSWRLAQAAGASTAAAQIAGFATAASPLLAVSVFSGMEVLLCTALLVWGSEALLGHTWQRAGTLLGLSALARPEAALVIMLGATFVVFASRPPKQGRARPGAALLRYAWPPALFGAAAIGYFLWASGRPMPATFYFKQTFSPQHIVSRAITALTEILPLDAPFTSGLIWLGLIGLLLPLTIRSAKPANPRMLFVFLIGFLFLLGNVALIIPSPAVAFYHQRYILPAIPFLLIALVHGLSRLFGGRSPNAERLLLAGFVLLTLVTLVFAIPKRSAHYHSDTRNINQLHRYIGTYLAQKLPPTAWVASNDAGGVRYFSNLPVVDMMGLNTPELYWEPERYARQHPVQAFVFMPSWFQVASMDGFSLITIAETPNYTVTAHPEMAKQFIVGCPEAKEGTELPLHFTGARDVTLYCERMN